LQPTAARWWTFFGDPGRRDPFHDATKDPLGETQVSIPSREQFELDVAERRSDLAHRAGLIDVEGELIRWTSRMDPGQVRGLYASMITVLRRPQPDQQRLLDAPVAIAAGEFGGVVEHRSSPRSTPLIAKWLVRAPDRVCTPQTVGTRTIRAAPREPSTVSPGTTRRELTR